MSCDGIIYDYPPVFDEYEDEDWYAWLAGDVNGIRINDSNLSVASFSGLDKIVNPGCVLLGFQDRTVSSWVLMTTNQVDVSDPDRELPFWNLGVQDVTDAYIAFHRSAAWFDSDLQQVEDCRVGSRLTLLCSVNRCSITTTEGLENSKDGFYFIHQHIAGFHASQFGFCITKFDMEIDLEKDISMDEKVTDPGKIMILKQVEFLHGSDHDHPRGIFTAPFPYHVIDTLITDKVQFLMGQPIMKATPPSSLILLKTFFEFEKSKFEKIFETCSHFGMYLMPNVTELNVADVSSPMATLDNEVVSIRYENLRNFDFVVDHSNHVFPAYHYVIRKPGLLYKIWQDCSILGNHLLDNISVMAYKPRMDFVRVVIIELHGPLNQDGLVVFDLFLTESYPSSLPLVRYESCGLSGIIPRINNFDDFKLGVSNVSSGCDIPWVPSMNFLQILVFIRDLILNTKPYYDKFINEIHRTYVFREWSAILCSENNIIKSLKTLAYAYTMNKPPKTFEDLVVGIFCKLRDILMACKAYMEGQLVNVLSLMTMNPAQWSSIMTWFHASSPYMNTRAKEAQEFHYRINTKKADVDQLVWSFNYFNVNDSFPYLSKNELNSRSSSFQVGENDDG